MATDQPIIRVRGLDKRFRLYARPMDRVKEALVPSWLRRGRGYHQPFHALSGVDLEVARGETVGIIGRNGSGKSTLLQVICGILRPTAGEVEVRGRISALLELGAGFNPEFSGRENVYLNASILGLSREEVDECMDDILAFADIGGFIDQPVKTYSSGMYVRLAFAVAINVRPDILVVDEALSVGDTLFQAKCFAKFREFQEQGVTILFVTHSMDLVIRYCATAHLLEQGRLLASGPSRQVVDAYNRLLAGCAAPGDAAGQREAGKEAAGEGPGRDLSERGNLDGGGGTGTSPRDQVAAHMKESEQRFLLNPQESRYGTGKASIVEAGIYDLRGRACQSLRQGGEYEFRMEVVFNEAVDRPIFAFTVKDAKALDISGTNTLYHDMDTGRAEAGERFLVRFRQRIPLAAGGYVLSFGCAGFEHGEYVVYERRYDMLAFEVAAPRPVVGLVDMDTRISVERL